MTIIVMFESLFSKFRHNIEVFPYAAARGTHSGYGLYALVLKSTS